jgi:SAM-dependent methyltransferase
MKILVAIASHGTANDYYLSQLVREYRSMSFDVDVVVLSNVQKEVGPGVELVVGLPTKDPWSLPFGHKKIFADRLADYDLFIYSEDDTLLTENNIKAFLRVSADLPENEIPGFLRYELGPDGRRNYPEIHGRFHWDATSVRRRGDYIFAFFTCEHSASYLITRAQLRRAIDSGGFLVPPHRGKYDLPCTAATDPYTQCGFIKVICVSHMTDFLVHHLPNKYIGTRFGIEQKEFDLQIAALLQIGQGGEATSIFLQTETKLADGWYSKDYYEPLRHEVITLIPGSAKRVLSIGCGSGATEGTLSEKEFEVTAIPLDPVISAGAADKGVEVICGDFPAIEKKLLKREFDCLLLLNVLHLVEDPVELLTFFGKFMASSAVAVALVPNMLRLPVLWGRATGDPRFKGLQEYEASGVHFSSPWVVREWFQSAGMNCRTTIDVERTETPNGNRIAESFLRPLMSPEFFTVAEKN